MIDTPTGAFRPTTNRRWTHPVRLTPLYHQHLARGARMVEDVGWLLPASYGDAATELAIVKDAAGLLDTSDLGKLALKGKSIETLLDGPLSTITQSPGVHLYRLTAMQAIVVSPPDLAAQVLSALERVSDRQATHLIDLTGALCALRLLGPCAPAILERVSAVDLAPYRFADGSVVQGGLANIHAVIARHDLGGLPGYTMYVDRDLGAYLWDTLIEQGAPLGLQPVGREAVEALS